MNHHLSTHPWYWQAAQHVLDSAGIPELHGITHHGHTSATLMHSGTQGRLIDARPAPRHTKHLSAWEQALDFLPSLKGGDSDTRSRAHGP